jgi:hypothetical protein
MKKTSRPNGSSDSISAAAKKKSIKLELLGENISKINGLKREQCSTYAAPKMRVSFYQNC